MGLAFFIVFLPVPAIDAQVRPLQMQQCTTYWWDLMVISYRYLTVWDSKPVTSHFHFQAWSKLLRMYPCPGRFERSSCQFGWDCSPHQDYIRRLLTLFSRCVIQILLSLKILQLCKKDQQDQIMAQLPSSHGIPQPSQPRKLRLGHKAHAEGTQNSSGQH